MSKKLLITLFVLSPVLWFAILLSVSLFLFYWRIDNEPSMSGPLSLLWAHRITFAAGFIGTAVINIFFILKKERKAWISWAANFAATLLYVPFFIFTLMLMV